MNKFWMVYNPQGRAPTYQHEEYQPAKAEAERLASLNAGSQFFVLEAVGVAKKVDVEYQNLAHRDPYQPEDVPF